MKDATPAARAEDESAYRPAWLAWTPFLLRPPALTRRQWRVLLLVVAASVFDRYDLMILQMALPRIQEGLGIPDAQVSGMAAIIKLGALLSFAVMLAADRLGRRRLLIFIVLGYTVLTGTTAFATTATAFVTLQFLARAFITAEVLLAAVIITEEFPPAHRGWGIGALLAMATLGGALAAVLFALIDVLPFGWRALYLVGLVPLLFIAALRRTMPETERFRRRQPEPSGGVPAMRPIVSLFRAYPGRLAAVAGLIFLFNFTGAAAFFLDPTYLQDAHGWRPWQVSTLLVVAGVVGLFGSTFVGLLGDRIGRRRVIVLFGSLLPVFIIAFYNASGPLLPLLWAGMAFTLLGVSVSMLALGTELFPTSYRSTVSGARTVLGTLGTVLGLAAHGVLFNVTDSQWSAISILAGSMFIAPFVAATALPESGGRTLEEIAPER